MYWANFEWLFCYMYTNLEMLLNKFQILLKILRSRHSLYIALYLSLLLDLLE